MTQIPSITLNNGIKMPQLGLGVWQTKDGKETINAIHAAVDSGYRLIDTASMYANEASVGQAVRTASVSREELFITTKLWNSDQGYDNALKAFDKSLKQLKLDYIDLYLIHWPVPALDKYVETWRALEEIHASGRVKSIGVCNFNKEHLEKLLGYANVPPVINQVELNPRLQQQTLRDYCMARDIQIESWSPIGGTGGDLLGDPILASIASKHQKSPAQVVIRWHLQLGLVVIPKSTHPDRIRQNADVFDFELDNDDMEKISSLNTNSRRGPDPTTMNTGVSTSMIQLASRLGLPRLGRPRK